MFPAHDYNHRHDSTVAQERERNPRLGGGRTVEEFVRIMAELDLPYPKRMDLAVPANQLCGDCPDETQRALRRLESKSIQG